MIKKIMRQMKTVLRRPVTAGPDQPACAPGQEGFPVADLIKAYTLYGAYQLRLEDKVGTIEKGKLADLVILEKNILEADPYQLHKVKVLLTMMNGAITHGNLSLEIPDAESNIDYWLAHPGQ